MVAITFVFTITSTFFQLDRWTCRNGQARGALPVKEKMAVRRRQGFLRQSNPGVPSDVMVCLRVLARTEREDCRRPCASFPPSSGPTAGLQLAAVMMTRIRIIQRCTRGRFAPHTGFVGSLYFISSRTGHGSSQVFEMLPAFSCISWACAFRAVMHPYFSVGPSRQSEALVWLPRRAGSSGISRSIHSLVKKTLHRHRAGFEPQRASSFMK